MPYFNLSQLSTASIFLLFMTILVPPIVAQDRFGIQDPNRSSSTSTGLQHLSAKRSQVSKRLNNVRLQLEKFQENESVQSSKIAQEVDLLTRTKSILSRQQNAKAQKAQLSQRLEELKREISGFKVDQGAEKSISFVVFDQLRTDLESSKARLASMETTLKATTETVENSRQMLDSRNKALRIAREKLNSNMDQGKKAELEKQAQLAELHAKLAEESLSLNRLLNDSSSLNKQILEATVHLAKNKIEALKDRVRFTDSDLQEIYIQIERQEGELKRAASLAESQIQFAEQDWGAAKRKLDANPESNIAKEELAAKRVERQLVQFKLEVVNLRIGRLSTARQTWTRRSQVFNGMASNEELEAWANEARTKALNLERERKVQLLAADDLRKMIVTLKAKLQSLSESSLELRPWIASQIESLQETLRVGDDNVASIDSSIKLNQGLLNEIEGDIERWTIGERLNSVWGSVRELWNTELTTIDDRPITIGKVILGIIFLILGLIGAKIISRILGNHLLRRFGLNEGAVAAIRSLTFYSLIVAFTLLALRFANVPLTVFTLLGGALAIGVGFGSQAIINNFISGLILLAERPIKVGDLVKLDELIGNVIHIGARSTRVRTGDNLDIIVPNSKFLENNVLNFTLGDDKFRSHICVGIAYGSATREASKLLIKAAEEHGEILDQPRPFVWFRDFGDNSLVFELHFWIKVRTLAERRRIESDIRFRVDNLFREASICIAFPQRDLHLDTVRPLEIRVLDSENSSAGESQLKKSA